MGNLCQSLVQDPGPRAIRLRASLPPQTRLGSRQSLSPSRVSKLRPRINKIFRGACIFDKLLLLRVTSVLEPLRC